MRSTGDGSQERSGDGIRVLEKALSVLLDFLPDDEARGPTQIAQRLGMPASTTHRVIKTLSTHGFLQRDDLGRYRLGPVLLLLSSKVEYPADLRGLARPAMEHLQQQTGETVLLSVVYEQTRLCIDKVESSHSLRHLVRVGERSPLHAAAAPKLLLAYLDPPEQERILQNLTAYTATTIVDPQRLRQELVHIRAQKYAMAQGELIEGVSSVAAPILDHTGTCIAAINVGGPSLRLSRQRLEECAPLVMDAARQISTQLRYFGGTFRE